MLQSKERIGRLDREITFIQPVISVGTSNEDKITDWEEIDEFPTVSARKIEEGGSWVIRYRDDLNVRMRLVWDTQVYEILNVAEADEGRKRFMNVLTQLLDNIYFT